jgi:hypothetical protein
MVFASFTRLAACILGGAAAGPVSLAESPPASVATARPAADRQPSLRHERVSLPDDTAPTQIDILSAPSSIKRRPAILMMGELTPDQPPPWSLNLLADGYMLVAFTTMHPPGPDPARRPAWLVFDARFAHGFALGAKRMPIDAGRVIDHLIGRGDVHPDKIGWFGSSSTGIPGLAVAAREPRLAALVAFVSTGAYAKWFDTWPHHDLWRGGPYDLWPETRDLLRQHDPILHVGTMYPTAVLMLSGAEDKIVDPDSARAFMKAARPYYRDDPNRLRLVVYEGFGHNLPRDVVQMYAEHWFRLYMPPTRPPPGPPVFGERGKTGSPPPGP